jgi:hypothetical protein
VNSDTVVRGWAEAIKQYARKGGYQECIPGDSTPPNYDPATIHYTVPAGYTVGYDPNQAVAYQDSSNLNLILLLDRSGSIAPASATAIAAEKAFLEALTNTGTVVSLVSFSDSATIDAGPTVITGDAAGTTGTLHTLEGQIATNFSGGTNWDAGLGTALGQVGKFTVGPAPLVVMVTDGDPTRYTDSAGTLQGDGSTVTAVNVSEAVDQANLLQNAAHSHIFAIGVTGSSGLNTTNLQAISGPKQYPATALADADGHFLANYMTVTDFTALKTALQDIATKLTVDTFSPTCPAAGDQGTQRLALIASSTDGQASEPLQVVVRRS